MGRHSAVQPDLALVGRYYCVFFSFNLSRSLSFESSKGITGKCDGEYLFDITLKVSVSIKCIVV